MGDLTGHPARAVPLTVWLTLLLIAVSAPHAAEDFQYDEFARLGGSGAAAAVALGLIYAAQAAAAFVAGRGKTSGLYLLAVAGLVWSVGALAIHGPEIAAAGVYRHGAASRALEIGIILLGAAAAITGVVEARRRAPGTS